MDCSNYIDCVGCKWNYDNDCQIPEGALHRTPSEMISYWKHLMDELPFPKSKQAEYKHIYNRIYYWEHQEKMIMDSRKRREAKAYKDYQRDYYLKHRREVDNV